MRLIFRFMAFLFAAATFVGLIGAAVVGYMIWMYSQDLPDHAQLQNYEPPVTTRVHAAMARCSPNIFVSAACICRSRPCRAC